MQACARTLDILSRRRLGPAESRGAHSGTRPNGPPANRRDVSIGKRPCKGAILVADWPLN